ncbi:hypothetical protein [Sporomusa acidovorans]|uniref:Transposase zinc-binding domain-containing protein n=1 Tax=Sporomusa acidovorans (strain ATCC 49682 / DSM 3132 / Mol) TaxID=1123286 RepID=A0ABZ3J0V8_SPOA4|nr:hypothetical protein [Sporomusa acidovorans]OZC15002.1 hypothetical protein SPACI_51170 [Sporomusa acidovorans DSM 3132]SDE83755.1 hypothetical protein SAMN04488499_102335 [Sporomusa acidovorans]
MNYSVLYVIFTLREEPEVFPAEDYRYNQEQACHELLITIFNQKLWVDTRAVRLKKIAGAAFCWKEYEEGKYIELNQANAVCPECGWWRCHVCDSCHCNKPKKQD